MQPDTLKYDTLNNRPLPKWLVDQKEGFTVMQPEKIVMREDHSLKISFFVTCLIILLAVTVLTVYFMKKFKQKGK